MVNIMETIECIEKRRSRRLFIDKEIPENLIKKLLGCAICAPSSQDCQPWHFLIVKDKKEELAGIKEEDNRQHILTAPISIIVCVDTEKSPTRWVEDGVTATENILLAAHDLNLGAVYVTVYKEAGLEIAEKIKGIFNIPKHIIPMTVVPVGYPDMNEELSKKELVDIDKIVHHDKW